ncbi:type I restriction enzyme, S subunit [Sphingopyxis sp. YR583]|uniref:restriction endonuclease subunit S n=1 Tax=Sphingopyxis sp. YR583 TaxID=1881047 RepID=UPI0008A73172|nr:restriction endonuclease subunit S [Sphingopyxis sp. YR583]SEH15741.1 type I restriction enzyme, S subunit [Sphingopyxis sp. YR583]
MTLPEGWSAPLIGDLTEVVTKGTTPTSLGFSYVDFGTRFVKAESLRHRRIEHQLCSAIEDDAHEALRRSQLREGDVLFTIAGTLGRVALVRDTDVPANTNQAVAILRPYAQCDSEYLSRYLEAVAQSSVVSTGGRGTGLQNLNLAQVSAIKVAFPPLSEQRRIVTKLNALTARLARARTELDRVTVLADHLRRGILTRAFSGKLTSDWRAEHGRGDAEWPVRALSDIAEVQGGIQVGKKRPKGAVLIDTPYLRVANVQRGWLKLEEVKTLGVTAEERARLLLSDGDILMNEGGDRDKLGRGWVWRNEVADCIHQNHVFRIRLNDDQFPPEFVSHYANEFGQPYFFDQGTQTTNLASISKRRVMALPVPVPDADEATEIVRRIDAAFARADRMEAEAARARALIDRLEAAILAKAFRGELVPQDPDDEPASVLLDRIRAERAAAPKPKRGRQAKRDIGG